MDFVIQTQGAEQLRLWEPASGARYLEAAARRLDLALGVDVEEYGHGRGKQAAGSRVQLPSRGQVQKRAVRFEAPSAYLRDLMEDENRYAASDISVQKPSVRNALSRIIKNLMDTPSIKLDEDIRKQWTAAKTLGPDQLLTILQSSLDANELQQCFAFRSILDRCGGILGWVKETYSKRIAHFRAPENSSEDFLAYGLASDILWQAARARRSSPRYLKYNTLLGAFAHAMSDYVGEASGELLKMARQSVESLRRSSTDEELGKGSTDDEKVVGKMELRVQGPKFAIKSTEPTAEEKEAWKRTEEATGEGRRSPESLSRGERRAIWERAVHMAL
ncbi:hypothetical protein B0A55_11072 [Friedmanniomyces simplex]|uniref:Uncharacterized protein n=1 Tax=Friedmanniomyces simplex TaxID=329884 RepID=A0A4V5NDP6_9PEZI|nr:hypothetical protein B0A55_11072 [Friedmanniomyces simplex]